MSTELNQKVANSFFGAAEIYTEQKINSAEFDKTISAEIIEVIDASIGKYRVKYQDANFYAYSENTSATYRKGTLVQILVPKGDMSYEYKTILGATKRLGINYVDDPDTDAVYVKNGGGCLISNGTVSIEVNSGEKVLYDTTTQNISLINENEIKQYLRNSASMLFSCKVKTNLPTSQRRQGKYGVRIKLKLESDTENPNGIDDTVKEFIFDTNDVVGTPYNIPVWVEQEKVFDLDKGNFEKIEYIGIFAEGFPEVRKGEANGIISFSDLNLFGANILDEDQVSTYHVDIATEKGKYFNNTIEELPLEAKVYIKGKLANRSEQKYKVYWFEKNARVTSNHEKYNKEGKLGWACLNEKLSETEWVDGDSILKLKKDSCLAKQTDIKCVIVYETQSFESEISIYNSDANYDFKIAASQDLHFTNDLGEAVLTLKASQKSSSDESFVEWEDKQYAEAEYVWVKTSITETMTELQTGPEHTLNIKAKDINIKDTYTCSVFAAGGGLLGTTSIEVYNEARAPEYTLVIINGKQTFKYDLNGYSPTHNANEHQTPIKELSFEIYDQKGQKVKDEVIAAKVTSDKIRWLITDTEDTLLDLSDYRGKTEQDSLLKYFILRDKTINIKIEDRYSYSASQNQIQLEVTYIKDDGSEYFLTTSTEFVFTKEGAQGTNGTDAGVCWISSDKPFLEIDNITNNEIQLKGYPDNGKFLWLTRKVKDGEEKWASLSESGLLTSNFPQKIDTNKLNELSHIIQYRTKVNDFDCTNTLPVVAVYYLDTKTSYRFRLKEFTGFLNVQYETNGRYPKYDMDKDFEIECSNNGEVLTDLKDLTFKWECSDLLSFKYQAKNKCKVIPSEHYDSYSYTQAIWGAISLGETTLAIVHIPIYFYLNKYSNAAINQWDGNGIEIDEDGGIILSPQVGAGKKNTDDNTFTGVIIGTKEDYNNNKTETGLFGYNHGEQTIFLDAETGKSEFGQSGKSKIVIDPSQENAQIYSGNYYLYDTDGNIQIDENGNKIKSNQGMLIDLTEPFINFGSGNFNVNSNGHITAKGGGTIAGWNIDNYKLSKENTGMSSVDTLENEGVTKGDFAKLKEKPLAFWAGKEVKNFPNLRDFMVAHDGTVKMRTAVIGKGTYTTTKDENGKDIIEDTNIYIGGGESKNSSIYSGKSSFKDYETEGFYLGADGFAIGRRLVGGEAQTGAHAFEVSKKGEVKMQSGQIGYGKEYWTVEGNAIKYGNKKTYDDKFSGVYIGTNGIGLGEQMFYVNAKGEMTGSNVTIKGGSISIGTKDGETTFYVDTEGNLVTHSITATFGSIGGWSISSNYLQAGQTKLSSTGRMEHTGGKWEIDSTGNAIFNNIKANGGTIGGLDINKDNGISKGTDSGSGNTGFSIDKNGKIKAAGASIYGSCDWVNGEYYLKMGEATNHPEVSGLNMTGTSGINMGKKGLGLCTGASNEEGDSNYTCRDAMSIRGGGTLYLRGANSANAIFIYTSNGFVTLPNFIKQQALEVCQAKTVI